MIHGHIWNPALVTAVAGAAYRITTSAGAADVTASEASIPSEASSLSGGKAFSIPASQAVLPIIKVTSVGASETSQPRMKSNKRKGDVDKEVEPDVSPSAASFEVVQDQEFAMADRTVILWRQKSSCP